MTVEKIHILSDEKQLLEQIPDSSLPTIVGGKCDCHAKGGCMASDAGPWNTPDGKEIIEKVKAEGGEKREAHEKEASGAAANGK